MGFNGWITLALIFTVTIAPWLFLEQMTEFAGGLVNLGWRFWQLVKAFDQRLIWALFSIGVFVICSFRITRTLRDIPLQPKTDKNLQTPDSLKKWVILVRNSNKRGHYAKWLLPESVFTLTTQIFFERDGTNQRQFRQMLENGEIELPHRIRIFLLAGSTPFNTVEKRNIFSSSRTFFPLDLNPEEMVRHLEDLYDKKN